MLLQRAQTLEECVLKYKITCRSVLHRSIVKTKNHEITCNFVLFSNKLDDATTRLPFTAVRSQLLPTTCLTHHSYLLPHINIYYVQPPWIYDQFCWFITLIQLSIACLTEQRTKKLSPHT